MHQSTSTLKTQHSYTFIEALNPPMKQPTSPLLTNIWLVSILEATAVTVLCCFLPKVSCCSAFRRVKHSTREAMTSVIPVSLSPLLVILIFRYSIGWLPKSWNHSTVESCCNQMLSQSNCSFSLPSDCQVPLVMLLPIYMHHLVALSASS